MATRQASATEPAPISVPREPVVWPAPSSRVVSTTTRTFSGSTPEFLDGHLERHGVDALAHLGPAVAHLDTAVVVEADDRLGDLDEAVAEPGVLQRQAQADGLACRSSGVVGRLDGIEALPGAESTRRP